MHRKNEKAMFAEKGKKQRLTVKDFDELGLKSARNILGHKPENFTDRQNERTLMARIFTKEERNGNVLNKPQMLRKLVEHGLPKERAINLVAIAKARPDGKLDFSLGMFT